MKSCGRGSKLPLHYHPYQFLLELQAIPVAKSARKRFGTLKAQANYTDGYGSLVLI